MTVPGRDHHQRPRARPPARARVPLKRLFRVSSIACGIQFGWALQLSLLTPYVQELGIPHAWASLVWLCGPLSGLLVQPLVGHTSDRCKSPAKTFNQFLNLEWLIIFFILVLICQLHLTSSENMVGLIRSTSQIAKPWGPLHQTMRLIPTCDLITEERKQAI